MKSNDGLKRKKKRKPYEKPTVTQLNPDDAKAKLRLLAEHGNEQAKEMLRALEQSPNKQKKSA